MVTKMRIKQNPIGDITVVETSRYVIVKIPRNKEENFDAREKSFSDLAGVLRSTPALRGRSSVEVQHMIKSIWQERIEKHEKAG